MEVNKIKKEDVVKEFFEKVKEPIIIKVLQENNLNPTREGREFIKGKIQWLWQPHNVRLYFDFDKKTFIPPTTDNPTLKKLKEGLVGFSYEIKNHNSEHHFDNFYGCRVILRNKSAEVINKWYHKQWKLMSATNIKDVGDQIFKVMEEMDIQCLDSLKRVIGLFGGFSNYNIQKKWFKGEHGIHGVPLLDSIPEEMVISDTVFKKQYKKKAELFNPVFVKNAVSNYVMEEVAPQIERELNDSKLLIKGILEINASTSKLFNQFSNTFLPVFTEYSRDVRIHNKVEKGIDRSFHKFNTLLAKMIERQTKVGDYR